MSHIGKQYILPVEVGEQSQIDSGYSSKDCNTSYKDCRGALSAGAPPLFTDLCSCV